MTGRAAGSAAGPGAGQPADGLGGGLIDPSVEQAEISAVLVALADPTRRQLLDVLVAEGNASATTLAGRLPVSRQAVVKHLVVLQDAGLVVGGRAGREVLYRVQPSRLDASARWLGQLAAAWDRRLATIKRIAEAAES